MTPEQRVQIRIVLLDVWNHNRGTTKTSIENMIFNAEDRIEEIVNANTDA